MTSGTDGCALERPTSPPGGKDILQYNLVDTLRSYMIIESVFDLTVAEIPVVADSLKAIQ